VDGRELEIVLLGAAAGALWIAAAAFLYVSRHPVEPPVGLRTLELGPEPPAVANLLVNDWRVGDEAIPATLIDLAARRVVEVEHRGPGVFYIRLRRASAEPLTAYERRVLTHLRNRASDGVVPAQALTTGPADESRRWRRAFTAEVVADAKARGLSREALDGAAFTVLTAAAVVPALLVLALSSFEAGIVVLGAALAILGWIRARHPQRETPQGLGAASRWLSVRAELAANEVFRTYSPLTVALWDRLLAYGAALGVAPGASGPLPMGTESDTDAWSAHGGRWRLVRVSYPRLWPPGWGVEPLLAVVAGLGAVVAGALLLYWLGPALVEAVDGGSSAIVVGAILLVPSGAVVVGIAVAAMAMADNASTVEVTGPILRLRAFGEEKKRRYYVAVDDGTTDRIRAWRVHGRAYVTGFQGATVRATVTGTLRHVKSIERVLDPAPVAG
jgi:hypothetical protein